MRIKLPSALVIGVSLSTAGAAAFATAAIAQLSDDGASFDSVIRWSMFSMATSVAALVLVAAALFAVANRVSGMPRTLLLIAASINLAWIGWMFGRELLLELLGEDKREWFYEYGFKLATIAFWSATVLITVAARAWWRPASPLVVIAAVVAVVFEALGWLPYVGAAIRDLRDEHPYIQNLIWPLREVLTSVALLVLIHGILQQGAAPPLPMPDHGAAWLRRASASLIIRVVAALALAVLGIGIVKTPALFKFVMVAGPLIMVVSIIGLAWSLLGVERAALPGMPKVRLVLGAALIAMAGGFQLNQLLAGVQALADRGYSSTSTLEVWSVLGPLFGVAGVVLACSAVASWALSIGDEGLREAAIARAVVHVVLSGLVMLVPLLMLKASSVGAVLFIALLAAIGGIASIVVVATVFRRAADAIQPSPALPQARIL